MLRQSTRHIPLSSSTSICGRPLWSLQYTHYSAVLLARSNTYSHLVFKKKLYTVREKSSTSSLAEQYDFIGDQRLADFRRAIADNNAPTVIEIYPGLLGHEELSSDDYLDLLRLLHYSIRARPPLLPHDTAQSHVSTFLEAYKSGLIPPSRRISLQLLGYFHQTHQIERGLEFWDWLVRQDDSYNGLACYGAAIELVVAGKDGDLQLCEVIYDRALQRFSRGFNQYHLQPGAITANPHLPTTIPGTSVHLLRGIVLARFAYGDWLHGYLAMDRALQLHPSLLSDRWFYIFLKYRPITEAYRIYCLLCSSGSRIPSPLITSLLGDLVSLQEPGRGAERDLEIALAILSAVHHGVGAGQKIDNHHLGTLMRSAFALLPKQIDDPRLYKARKLGNTLGIRLTSLFHSLGIPLDHQYFRNLISVAGDLNDKALLEQSADALANSDMDLDNGTLKVIKAAACSVGDLDPIRKLWTSEPGLPDLDSCRSEILGERLSPPPSSSNQLTSDDDASTENQASETISDENTQSGTLPGEATPKADSTFRYLSPRIRFGNCLDNAYKFLDALESFESLVKSGNVRDMRGNPPERSSIFKEPSVPESWQYKLYRELATDPASRRNSQKRGIDVTKRSEPNPNTITEEPTFKSIDPTKVPLGSLLPTNFSLEEIRFRNWCGINEILVRASAYKELLKHPKYKALLKNEAEDVSGPDSTSSVPGNNGRREAVRVQVGFHVGAHSSIHLRKTNASEGVWRNEILRLRRSKLRYAGEEESAPGSAVKRILAEH